MASREPPHLVSSAAEGTIMVQHETNMHRGHESHTCINQGEPLTSTVKLVHRKRKADSLGSNFGSPTASSHRVAKQCRVTHPEPSKSHRSGTLQAADKSRRVAQDEGDTRVTRAPEPSFPEIEDPCANLETSGELNPLGQMVWPEERSCLGAVDLPGTAAVFGRRGVTIHSQVFLGPSWGTDEGHSDGSHEESWAAVQQQVGEFFDNLFGL
ncbi:hypothetical protein HJFPF1_04855 [Paramyrothecium foliicola]|nr:hypothetical protein HJFPF1_04855 [Paramyrothecium foliicola]